MLSYNFAARVLVENSVSICTARLRIVKIVNMFTQRIHMYDLFVLVH